MVVAVSPEEMVKRIAGITKGCEDGVRRGLVRAAAIAEIEAKKNLTKGSSPYDSVPFDTGLLRGHLGYVVDVQSVDEYIASVGVEANVENDEGVEVDMYGLYVHEGTRPHRAPMEAIKKWAERKNRGKNTDINWFGAWKKIAEEGTPPHPFLLDAIKSTQNQYLPLIEEEYRKALIAYCARFA